MTESIKRIRLILFLFIPFLLFVSIVFYTQTSHYFQYSDVISSWIILDLLLTIPFVYFLVIRKTKIPNTSVISMVFLGLILGYYILPVEQHTYLDLFKKFGLPVIEISVLVFVLIKVRKAIRTFNANSKDESDFYNILQKTCREIIPGRMSSFIVSEISVIYYSFLNWKKPILKESEFTYHKKSGTPALFGALIFIVLVETISVHIILLQWSHLAAFILSILSIYTGLQLLGFGRSLSKRPISISNGNLILRYGILNEATIRIDEIESIVLSRKTLKYDDEIQKFSILGDLETHNVVIKCNKLQKMEGVYGITKTFSTLTFFVDEKDRFKNMIEQSMQKNELE